MNNEVDIPQAPPAPLTIQASRDPHTGQVYVPPRAFAADGSLRPTQPIDVLGTGVLYSVTTFNGQLYGVVDLDAGARVQALLDAGHYAIGQRLVAVLPAAGEGLRFTHA